MKFMYTYLSVYIDVPAGKSINTFYVGTINGLRDLFLFVLQDESFMSKIISEESPDVTTTQLQNKLKCLEASQATAKYIKSGDAKEVHQIKKTKKHKKPWSKQGTVVF